MATFPTTLKIGMNSKRIDRDGREVDHAGDGVSWVRKLHVDKADFTIVLTRMTSADVTSLFSFYDANANLAFDFVWPPDGLTYSQKFASRPRLTEYKKAGYFTYEVAMVAA